MHGDCGYYETFEDKGDRVQVFMILELFLISISLPSPSASKTHGIAPFIVLAV